MKLSWRGAAILSIPIILSLAVPFAVGASNESPGKFLDEHHLNGIVAVVNDRVITVGELQQEIAPILTKIESETLTEQEYFERSAMAFRDLLDDSVVRALIVQDFERSGMKIPNVQKEFQIDEFIRNRFGGDRVLFTQQLRAYGKSVQQFKREMEEALIAGWALTRFHYSRAAVSPRQIREYYDSHQSDFMIPSAVRLGLICLPEKVLANSGRESEDVANESMNLVENPEIAQIASRLNNGEPFAALAEDLNKSFIPFIDEWLSLEDLRDELRAVVERMQVESCSKKIHLSDGKVAFLYLYERRMEMFQPIEHVQSSIENTIVQSRREADQIRWINDLRAKAYVRIYGQTQ
ncbi:MAG: SurA N-terminal domain-containing protein [Puniceicoccales bacterium]|jgi:hypothetical protein|nr:SurA N-terminal domain-containing protein [Puniceicoccales bacterium]